MKDSEQKRQLPLDVTSVTASDAMQYYTVQNNNTESHGRCRFCSTQQCSDIDHGKTADLKDDVVIPVVWKGPGDRRSRADLMNV